MFLSWPNLVRSHSISSKLIFCEVLAENLNIRATDLDHLILYRSAVAS